MTAGPASKPAASCIVEASAGTGKTRELVNRIVDALRNGAKVEGIVAVTFTHAAAGEMKLRVRQELDRTRQSSSDPDERERMANALEHLEEAFIGTIHAFCAQLLRQRPVEAGVDPSFKELAQPEALRLFKSVFDGWMVRKLNTGSALIRRCLSRLAWREELFRSEPLDELRRAAWNLVEWRDFPGEWERRPFDREAETDLLIEKLARVLEIRNRCARPERDLLYLSLQAAADVYDRIVRSRAVQRADYDTWEAELIRLPKEISGWRLKPGYGGYGENLTREAVLALWTEWAAAVDAFRERADADLAAAIRAELWDVVELYQRAKNRVGRLDFMDLLIRARDLLKNSEARQWLQSRYTHLFVDEFQDTDPLQAEILLLLSADDPLETEWRNVTPAPGKLFVVGDPKQSIYRFRRADVGLYREICECVQARGIELRTLQASLRSTKPVQNFVNAAFGEALPNYLPLEGGREPLASQPSIVALPIPEPYGKRDITKTAINLCSPNAVAAFADWLVHQSGWKVSDPVTQKLIPVAPEHIAILFRRFTSSGTDLTLEYVRCLEARGIPHVLIGSKSFHRREEVGTIRAALRAIEWPDDELNVFATIRGTLFSVPDGTLLKFRDRHGGLHPFKPLPDDLDEEFAPVREALEFLAELHRRRNYRPIADTIVRILEHTRAHAGFAFRKGGERVLANVYRLTDLARGFEATAATSFRSFVEYLDEESDAGEAAEAPLLEQDAGGVKLMTVHKAKGLEFPVVILADLTAGLTGADGGDRYVDSARRLCAQRLLGCAPWELLEHREDENKLDRAEAYRTAYVAATRARDLLVVSGVGDKEFADGWLSPFDDALYPPREDWRNAREAPGCGRFGAATVLRRPDDFPPDEISVRPGAHRPRSGGHQVVWFDPALLDLSDRRSPGLDHEAVLSGTPAQITAGIERYTAWKQAREQMVTVGSRPTFDTIRASEMPVADFGPRIPVEVTEVMIGGARPAGRRFGKLVHAMLQDAARGSARAYGAREDEIAAAERIVAAVLEHPILRQADQAKQCHREFPVMVRLDDGRLVEGFVDLAFSDGVSWTVVDFKTGLGDQQRYRRQLELYGLAIQKMSGLPVRGVVLEI